MNEKLACEKFCQILSAVEYCHLKNIVHRDLKVNTIKIVLFKRLLLSSKLKQLIITLNSF